MCRSSAVVLLIGIILASHACAVGEDPSVQFTLPQLQKALKQYHEAIDLAAGRFDQCVDDARHQVKQELDQHIVKLTKAGDIDQAVLLRDAVARLDTVLDRPLSPDDTRFTEPIQKITRPFAQRYLEAADQFEAETKPSRTTMISQLEQAQVQVSNTGDLDELLKLRTLKGDLENAFLSDATPRLWRDIFAVVDLEQHVVSGYWRWAEQGVAGRNGFLLVPLRLEGAYELAVAFTRHQGAETRAVEIDLPIGPDRRFNLVLDGYGVKHLTGLSRIRGAKGNMVTDNGTGIRYTLPNDQPQVVQVKVSPQGDHATINVELNGGPLIKWSGPLADIETDTQPCLRLGAGLRTSVTFDGVLLRMLQGQAVLAPGPAKRRPNAQVKTFTGLGISFTATEDGLTVNNVLQSSPAEQAGIRAGDIITDVESNKTAGMNEADATNLIRGPAGTALRLVIKTPGGKTRQLRIRRGVWAVQVGPNRPRGAR